MPLEVGLYGTNADGSANSEYCKYCFEKGEFREPDLTIDAMVGRVTARMIDEQKMPEEEAQNLAETLIPNLKRWQAGR